MLHNVPQRQPVGDPVTGDLIRLEGAVLLVVADGITPSDAVPIASGRLIARYGLQYLGKPHLSIVPALLALDYGEILTGDAAFDFVRNRSNLYPRADVVGYRSDGVDDMVPIKWLDLAQPIHVWIYADEHATAPLASPAAIIGASDQPLPNRLLKFLPAFDSIHRWKEAQERESRDV